MMFPSVKATSSKFSPDRIRAIKFSRCSSRDKGSSLRLQLCASTLWRSVSTLRLKLEMPGNSGNLGSGAGGSGTSWSSSEGVCRSTGVVVPVVVTPVTLELLLSVCAIKSSSIW